MISDDLLPYVLAGIALVLVFNLGVTLALIRDDGVTSLQRTVHALVIWLIPILGGALILALVGSHHTKDEMKSMVPFPFYLAGVPHPKTPYGSNPIDGGGGEGSCGGDGD